MPALFTLCLTALFQAHAPTHEDAQPLPFELDGTRSIELFDLDGDGNLDLLTGGRGGDGVAWFPGDGSGRFRQRIPISDRASKTWDLDAADLDLDGDLDVLAADHGSNRAAGFWWYENLGGGQFGGRREIEFTRDRQGAHAICAADLDGDGDADVISGHTALRRIAVHENLGGAAFGSPVQLGGAALEPTCVTVSDVDLDGDLDVLAALADDHMVVWYENLGSLRFSSASIIATNAFNVLRIDCADLTGDQHPEVVWASPDTGLVAYHSFDPLTGFGPPIRIDASETSVGQVTSYDFDRDGDHDVVFANSSTGTVYWAENLGGATFGMKRALPGSVNATDLAVGDLNHDGWDDLGTCSYTRAYVYRSMGKPYFRQHSRTSTHPEGVSNLLTVDLDLDGDDDLIEELASTSPSRIYWHENLGPVGFSGRKLLLDQVGEYTRIAAADFDLDGDVDIATNSRDTDLGWHENLGSLRFSSRNHIANLGISTQLLAADLMGNGLPDLIVRDDSGVSFFRQVSTGVFAPSQQISTYGSDFNDDLVLHDLNGDSRIDLVVSNKRGSELLWYENLGGGQFQGHSLGVAASVHFALEVFDWSGDGQPDIFSTEYEISWRENLGNGTFSPARPISHLRSGRVSDLSHGDMDQDGDLDLVLASEGDQASMWIENLGNGNAGEQRLIHDQVEGGLYTRAITGDFSLDGFPDVIRSSSSSGTLVYSHGVSGGPSLTARNFRAGEQGVIAVLLSTPHAAVSIARSFRGSGPILTPLGLALLSEPIQIAGSAMTDVNGQANFVVLAPSYAVGWEVHLQAIDHASGFFSNGLSIRIED